jgi:MarR family transcriptional regulator, organic hydroperoxide resistance regulator
MPLPDTGRKKNHDNSCIDNHQHWLQGRGMKDAFVDGGIVVDRAIGFWIHRVLTASRLEMYRRFREQGEDITPEQWAVLIRLWEKDGITQSELSEATFRDKPTMSRIVDSMEGRGLVERRVDPNDARARLIHLTRRGRALRTKLVPVAEDIVKRMTRGIDTRALETTRDSLRRMFANLAE